MVDNSAPGSMHDDKTLRKIFDSKDFWKDFSSSSKPNGKGRNAGLFRNKYLTSPKGFMDFSYSNLQKARRIVERVLAAKTIEEYRTMARDLDRLSDTLCRVIDLSDFVRSTHPDGRIQQAANQAHATMFEYMNQLNTMTGLNEQLAVAMANDDIWNNWSEEERVVARALKKDFTNSAISLPKAMRERFVSLSQKIAEVGPDFMDYMRPEKNTLSFPSSKLKGMDPRLAKQLTRWGTATIPTVGDAVPSVLRNVYDDEVRREVYMATRTSAKSQLGRLDELLNRRAELAKLTQYESYGHLTLGEKMAKSPASVDKFLRALSQGNQSRTQQELAELTKAKMSDPESAGTAIQPWDKDFYVSKIKSKMRSTARNSDFLSSYFSLGTVMQGLSRLFTRLYGIRFAPRESLPGEAWNEDVRRLDVISETDGHVAVLYCDLFSRPGKSPNPAHFTLRCSREIAPYELAEEASKKDPLFTSPEEASNDGMSVSSATETLKQLPTIALICDFRTPSSASGNKPALLTFGEVQTLFHEMGHAIHSILGRTRLQEVSGTRCATDFAELPSVLMEHFAADPYVLSLFARHYETDAPLPYDLVLEKLSMDKKFRGIDTEGQIVLAMVDQAYHSSDVLKDSFDTSTVFHNIQKHWGVMPPDPAETSWQGFFGHLYGYGASYYSYLFDQVLAERIWRQVFANGNEGGGVQRENGERMKESVLKWGGGRDPWKCLAEVLQDERVANGDESAMSIVGSWGAKARN